MSSLIKLIKKYPHHWQQGSMTRTVAGVTADSRKVGCGWVFVAIKGSRVDGHQFIAQALARGATTIVVERPPDHPLPADITCLHVSDGRKALAHLTSAFHGHPSRGLRLIGVTGTNGKTTSTYLLEAMLQAHGFTPGVIGTVTYRYGEHQQPADQTTPSAEDLQRLLRDMVDAGVSHCVMEVSSHALAQERVWGCRFAAALFTNLSRDHLDFHKDIQAYYAAKARLFTEYRPELAVVNRDDVAGERLLREIRAPVVTYGFSPAADVSVEHLSLHAQGFLLFARVHGQIVRVCSHLMGRHNAYNILGALAMASGLDMELGRAIQGLENLPAVPGRFERVDEGQPFSVLVDYAHTDDALRNVLLAARGIASGRVIVVFGAGGDRDQSKRVPMGRVAAEHADIAIITSDNPRTESPMDIIRALEAGYKEVSAAAECYVIEDRASAIREAIKLGRAGDTVVIAGKGHETYQIVGAQRLPFDDREVARRTLRAMGFSRTVAEVTQANSS